MASELIAARPQRGIEPRAPIAAPEPDPPRAVCPAVARCSATARRRGRGAGPVADERDRRETRNTKAPQKMRGFPLVRPRGRPLNPQFWVEMVVGLLLDLPD